VKPDTPVKKKRTDHNSDPLHGEVREKDLRAIQLQMDKNLARFINGLIIPAADNPKFVVRHLSQLQELATQAREEAKFGRALAAFPLSPGSLIHHAMLQPSVHPRASVHCAKVWYVPPTMDVALLSKDFVPCTAWWRIWSYEGDAAATVQREACGLPYSSPTASRLSCYSTKNK
jgi:hypothetical protein